MFIINAYQKTSEKFIFIDGEIPLNLTHVKQKRIE